MKSHPRSAFTDILAAYAAGHTILWQHTAYVLTGAVEDPRVPHIGSADEDTGEFDDSCGLFCDDGTSIYDPADFYLGEPPLAEPENDTELE